MTGEEDLERTEVEALLETRRELGSTYDRELVDSFADRIERVVEQRMETRTGRQVRERDTDDRSREGGRIRQFVLGVISAGVGVPITIVPVLTVQSNPGAALTATALGWIGLISVNAAHAAAVNGRRR